MILPEIPQQNLSCNACNTDMHHASYNAAEQQTTSCQLSSRCILHTTTGPHNVLKRKNSVTEYNFIESKCIKLATQVKKILVMSKLQLLKQCKYHRLWNIKMQHFMSNGKVYCKKATCLVITMVLSTASESDLALLITCITVTHQTIQSAYDILDI